MSPFNEQAILEQAAQLVLERAKSYDLSEEEATGYAQFVSSFNQVAASELAKEPGIILQEGAEPIPITDEKALQAVSLFGEGILYCILRCRDYNLPGELAEQLTQQVAMHVYEQAKQVVAATHGQEHTPEFQFSPAQQAEFITQGTESALVHYINEYEKAYGPIHPEPEPELPTTEAPSGLAEAEPPPSTTNVSMPTGETPPVETRPTAASASEGAGRLEKFAALALLLKTLPPATQEGLLKQFGAEEKSLITFYNDPRNIEANLNVAAVATELRRLKATLAQKQQSSSSGAKHSGVQSLVGLISKQKLLSCLKDERPVVQQFVLAHYPEASQRQENEGGTHASLSPRLQEIVYQYLSKRLAPELQTRLPNPGSPSI